MTKYIEIGLGNSWLVRTEYEKMMERKLRLEVFQELFIRGLFILEFGWVIPFGFWISKKGLNSKPSLVSPSNVLLALYQSFDK